MKKTEKVELLYGDKPCSDDKLSDSIYVVVFVHYDHYRFQENLYASNNVDDCLKFISINAGKEDEEKLVLYYDKSEISKLEDRYNERNGYPELPRHYWIQKFEISKNNIVSNEERYKKALQVIINQEGNGNSFLWAELQNIALYALTGEESYPTMWNMSEKDKIEIDKAGKLEIEK